MSVDTAEVRSNRVGLCEFVGAFVNIRTLVTYPVSATVLFFVTVSTSDAIELATESLGMVEGGVVAASFEEFGIGEVAEELVLKADGGTGVKSSFIVCLPYEISDKSFPAAGRSFEDYDVGVLEGGDDVLDG